MMQKSVEARVGTLFAGLLLSCAVLAADSSSAISSLVVPKDGESRHPIREADSR